MKIVKGKRSPLCRKEIQEEIDFDVDVGKNFSREIEIEKIKIYETSIKILIQT